MKKYLILVFTILLSFTLFACGDKTENLGEVIDFSETHGKKTELRVWLDDEKGEYMEAIIKEFNKIYPNIYVRFLHKGSVESREQLKTFGPSGNGADVFQFPYDHLAQAILEDLVLALPSDTKQRVEARSHELGVQIATLSYNEETHSFDPNDPNAVESLYAVPMSIESVGLYYNKDLVETPAATYEELFAAADIWNNSPFGGDESGRTNAEANNYYLTTSSHWADSYFMQHIYSAFGFYPFGETLDDPSEVGFANAEEALVWMREELKPRTTGNGDHESVGGAGFEAGDVPYIIAGPWNNEAYKNAGLNYGVAPLPTIDGKETKSFAGAMMAAVYKYSKNQEAAIKFVEFLSSDIAMQLQYDYKQKLPALKGELLVNIEGVLEDELLMAMSRQLETSIPMPTIPQVTYYWGPGETMIKDTWNGEELISKLVTDAEHSYRTNVGLGQ